MNRRPRGLTGRGAYDEAPRPYEPRGIPGFPTPLCYRDILQELLLYNVFRTSFIYFRQVTTSCIKLIIPLKGRLVGLTDCKSFIKRRGSSAWESARLKMGRLSGISRDRAVPGSNPGPGTISF